MTRLETSRLGRALINLGLVVTLAAIGVANLPTSTIKDHLLPIATPYLNALGIGQDWGVFSPNPRTEVVYASGELTYSDGSQSQWHFPLRPGIMAYSDYRWQKFEEHVRLDAFGNLWRPFADYLVAHQATAGKTVISVRLVRRWAEILPPGAPYSLGPWTRYVYFFMPIGGPK